MNVEIGTEAAQFPEKKYIHGIFVVVQHEGRNIHEFLHISILTKWSVSRDFRLWGRICVQRRDGGLAQVSLRTLHLHPSRSRQTNQSDRLLITLWLTFWCLTQIGSSWVSYANFITFSYFSFAFAYSTTKSMVFRVFQPNTIFIYY